MRARVLQGVGRLRFCWRLLTTCTSVPRTQLGHFVYEGKGMYKSHKLQRVAKHLSMIAGGTGEKPTITLHLRPACLARPLATLLISACQVI